jgi:putative DNA primase/helicase
VTTLDHARRHVAAGLSVIPVRGDGSKAAAVAGWREFSDRRPTEAELAAWFRYPARHGIGIPGGPASGNLVVLDFEVLGAFLRWGQALRDDERAALAGSPVICTPKGGRHVYVRTVEPVKGCKLARTAAGETVIETRGCQHYVVAPGSPAACHPTGRPYTVARAGWLNGGPHTPMALEVFHGLTVHAAELNEYARPAAHEVVGDRHAGAVTGDRPGDEFNSRVPWGDILGTIGWKVYQSTGKATYWCRPGKKPAGISASTDFCKGQTGGDLLYVFSTSAAPFEAERSYSKFAAYALTRHGGDFTKATKALALAGYGVDLKTWLNRQPKLRVGGKVVSA